MSHIWKTNNMLMIRTEDVPFSTHIYAFSQDSMTSMFLSLLMHYVVMYLMS